MVGDESTKVCRQNYEAYLWGSNSSHQLAEGPREKFLLPKLIQSFSDVLKLEAGQYCTFALHSDGRVSGCGKGSYGRLGLGDSNNQKEPKYLPIYGSVKTLSSSKGSDGHTLCLTYDGSVYSWGDGEHGKLGHGNSSTQKVPKKVMGPLAVKNVVNISAGYRHSAAVTADGLLYAWGEGDFGRLGNGDGQSRFLPVLVRDLTNVGSVSCGGSHTVALSRDGRTVWSFGSGESGKLGHGDTSRQYRPKVVDALEGMEFDQVHAGSSATLALTIHGEVWVWGAGPCTGAGTGDEVFLVPKKLGGFPLDLRVVDLSVGESHCLALMQDCSVYAWGLNAMGQCGLGHNSPVTLPQRIKSLEGLPIHQISAGTSHSMAWTALPLDRRTVQWQKPFCIDVSGDMFNIVCKSLEDFGFDSWDDTDEKVGAFNSSKDRHNFILSITRLLSPHLILASHQGNEDPSGRRKIRSNFGGQLRSQLESVLYKFMDLSNCPEDVTLSVQECLQKGVEALLPSLQVRVKKSCKLLNTDASTIKRSQQMNLKLILRSLNEPTVITSLLPVGCESLESKSKRTAEETVNLLRILLQQSGKLFASKLDGDGQPSTIQRSTSTTSMGGGDSINHDKMSLLYTLHTHFVLSTINGDDETPGHLSELSLDYLKLVFVVCQDLFEQCTFIAKNGSLSKLASLFSPNSAFTCLHILHFTLVALFDSSISYVSNILVHLSDLQSSTIGFLQTVVEKMFAPTEEDTDEPRVDCIEKWKLVLDINALITILIAQKCGVVLNTTEKDNEIEEKMSEEAKELLQSPLFAGRSLELHQQHDVEALGEPNLRSLNCHMC